MAFSSEIPLMSRQMTQKMQCYCCYYNRHLATRCRDKHSGSSGI